MWALIAAGVLAGGTWLALRLTDEGRRIDALLAAVRDTAEDESRPVR